MIMIPSVVVAGALICVIVILLDSRSAAPRVLADAPTLGVASAPRQRISHEKVTAQNEQFVFHTSDFADGNARYFTYKVSGTAVNFFVLKSSDGIVRAAFDACDVCYQAKKGYRQAGDLMVCNNCGQTFPSVRVNEEKGGCNPSPLQRTVEGDSLIIQVADVAGGARYF